jgi:hypothetical protein
MTTTSFYEQVKLKIEKLYTRLPLDEAILGASLADADWIVVRNEIKTLLQTKEFSDELELRSINNALLPVGYNNLFIELHSSIIENIEGQPGHLGIHLVSYDQARLSRLFQTLGAMPEQFLCWPNKYVLVIYRDHLSEIQLVSAGAAVALDADGDFRALATFSTAIDTPLNTDDFNDEIEESRQFVIKVAWFVFSLFEMISQSEVVMHKVGQSEWMV